MRFAMMRVAAVARSSVSTVLAALSARTVCVVLAIVVAAAVVLAIRMTLAVGAPMIMTLRPSAVTGRLIAVTILAAVLRLMTRMVAIRIVAGSRPAGLKLTVTLIARLETATVALVSSIAFDEAGVKRIVRTVGDTGGQIETRVTIGTLTVTVQRGGEAIARAPVVTAIARTVTGRLKMMIRLKRRRFVTIYWVRIALTGSIRTCIFGTLRFVFSKWMIFCHFGKDF